MHVLYLEQFLLFMTAIFFGGLHPTISHVAIQLSIERHNSNSEKQNIFWLAYSRKTGTLLRNDK